jgi:hypothetical protein
MLPTAKIATTLIHLFHFQLDYIIIIIINYYWVQNLLNYYSLFPFYLQMEIKTQRTIL